MDLHLAQNYADAKLPLEGLAPFLRQQVGQGKRES